MSADYTIAAFTNRNKPDKYGNGTFTVKFVEDERSVYAVFKNEPRVGDKKYGDILDGEYGPRFKAAQKPDDYQPSAPRTAAPTHISQSMPQVPSQAPQRSQGGSNDRADEIRWQVAIKEANAYLIANRPDLDAEKWSQEVNEYARALYFITTEPTKEKEVDEGAIKEFFGGPMPL